MAPSEVTVAPLVLLSIVDHHKRVTVDSDKRVVGVILGSRKGTHLTAANSFAVPFEEDERHSDVWFLDHNYIEAMLDMFHKVNANERLIGWYHSGPKLRSSDMKINELFRRYTPDPVLLVVDIESNDVGIPTNAYVKVDEVSSDGLAVTPTFAHIPSDIKAEEAEEIGVEHLLRDVRSSGAGTLSTRITAQVNSLQGLAKRLRDIGLYLDSVASGELPINHSILGELQDIFNLLPNLSATQHADLARAFTINNNDQLMVVYLASIVRAIVAFHGMIDNKIENKSIESV